MRLVPLSSGSAHAFMIPGEGPSVYLDRACSPGQTCCIFCALVVKEHFVEERKAVDCEGLAYEC